MVIPVHDENDLARRYWPFVTWGLVAANVLAYLAFYFMPVDTALRLLFTLGAIPAFVSGHVDASEIGLQVRPELTVVTYMFLHGSWVHLAGNMIFLWVFGDNVEAATGHVRFLALYLLSGVAGAFAHVLSDATSFVPLIGASGAIAGVVASYLLLQPFAKVTLLVLGFMTVRLHAYWVLGAWIAWQVINALIVHQDAETSYWGHVGGFMAGALLFLVLRRPGVKLFNTFRPGTGPRQAH